MITVSHLSLWLAEVSMTYWVVFFQYYWFPQLRPQPFTLYCFLLGLLYASLDLIAMLLPGPPFMRALTSALPAMALLGIEMVFFRRVHWRYLPAFIEVTILAYLLIEFLDTASISAVIGLTNIHFATSLKGTVTELVFDNVVFGLLIVALWGTQAPMENLIRSMIGRTTEYLFLIFMTCMGLVFMMFEYTLQLLDWSPEYVVFMATVSGSLIMGLSLATYILLQAHLQRVHEQAQEKEQRFQEQYSTELARQMRAIRKFQHDYQNMLVGLGGYLNDQDYQGFRQLYIDIRSGWQTSNAAELTIDDLDHMPRGIVQYGLYHDYLLAQQLGVDLFINIPQPLTATVVVGRRVGEVLSRSLPPIIQAVTELVPAIVTLKITEEVDASYLEITFPVPMHVRVVGGKRLIGPHFHLNLAGLLQGLPVDVTSQLRVKLHWGQLLVILPMK